MNLPPVIGITICNKPYEALAHQAAASFRKYTGSPAIILTTDETASYDWKYCLPEIAGDRVFCFFDSDVLVVRPLDLSPFVNINGIAAVRDASRFAVDSFCLHDALELGFSPENYTNTGFFIANSRVAKVCEAFDLARRMMAGHRAEPLNIKDVTEQSLLCAAWHKAGVEMTYLDDSWNFWPHSIARGWMDWIPKPKIIHAAGIPLHQKAEFLAAHQKVFEY